MKISLIGSLGRGMPLLVMKLVIIFMIAGLLQVQASALSQTVTLHVRDMDMQKVLTEIKRQTGYVVFSDLEILAKAKPITLDIKDESIEKTLQLIFSGQPLGYRTEDKTILVYLANPAKEDAQKTAEVQQRITVTGRVLSEANTPLRGVSVKVKGGPGGTATDEEGRFSIQVDRNSSLLFSYIGYKEKEMALNGNERMDVSLEINSSSLDQVVVVGYGTQKKVDVTGSISSIQADDLAKVPVSTVTNALVGKIPGLIAIQSSGQPGMDASNLNIRGFGNALVIVDGVESNFRNIDASQIENVTILKDGAASIYGSRAGNGVILVTTKRGVLGKPTITFNGTTTLQRPTYLQNMISSGDYTTLVSEAYLQSGQPANAVPYTPEQIQKYYEAKEPGYYNTDWQKLILRNWAPMQNYNASVRGGSDRIKYYAFLGTLNQGAFWKKNGGDYKRYNFQTNVDAKILDNLSLGVTVSNIVDNTNSTNRPQNGGGYLFADLYNNKPMYPSSLPDPSKIPYSGSATGGALVQSNRDLGGYTDDHFQTLTESATINYDIKSVKGLSLKAFGNYSQINDNQKSYGRPVDMYTYNVDNEQYTLAAQFNQNTPLSQQKSVSTTLTGQFSVNYNTTINEAHKINAMLLYEVYSYNYDYISAGRSDFTFPTLDQLFAGSASTVSNNGSESQMSRASYVGRVNYAYKDKYLAEVILRADASAKFPSGSRWGYFPSVSFGWRLDQENFMKGLKNLDVLKLRGSYGQSGYDGIGDFQYLSGYGYTLMPVLFGGNPVMGISPLGLANPNLSWERIAIYNVGIEYSLFNRGLYGELDGFYRKLNGIPAQKTVSLPSSFGTELPLENLNSQTNRGFEVSLGTAGSAGHWKWDFSGNISWQRAKWGHVEEIAYTDPDSKRIYQLSGQWQDRTMGYRSDGLFTSQDQIDNLGFAYPGNPVLQLGDVRYVDTNNDKVLDWKDEVEIGKGQVPEWMAGLNMNVRFKDFDLSALFQSAFGYYKNVNLVSYTQTFFDNRWTQATNDPNALIPRLGGAGTNGLLSDRNFIKADYLRLKTFSIGYNLPKDLATKISFQNIRIYIGGSNLFTFSKLNKFDIDPESPFTVQDGQPTTSYYPQQKTIMLGVNLSL